MVVFFEEEDTPYAISVTQEVMQPILKGIPGHLQEIAEKAVEYGRKLLGE